MVSLIVENILGVWLVKVLYRVGICVHLITRLFIVFFHFVLVTFILQLVILQDDKLVMEDGEETSRVEGPSG